MGAESDDSTSPQLPGFQDPRAAMAANELLAVSAKGNILLAKKALAAGMCLDAGFLNVVDDSGRSPLHLALLGGSDEMAEFLIEQTEIRTDAMMPDFPYVQGQGRATSPTHGGGAADEVAATSRAVALAMPGEPSSMAVPRAAKEASESGKEMTHLEGATCLHIAIARGLRRSAALLMRRMPAFMLTEATYGPCGETLLHHAVRYAPEATRSVSRMSEDDLKALEASRSAMVESTAPVGNLVGCYPLGEWIAATHLDVIEGLIRLGADPLQPSQPRPSSNVLPTTPYDIAMQGAKPGAGAGVAASLMQQFLTTRTLADLDELENKARLLAERGASAFRRLKARTLAQSSFGEDSRAAYETEGPAVAAAVGGASILGHRFVSPVDQSFEVPWLPSALRAEVHPEWLAACREDVLMEIDVQYSSYLPR